MSEDSLNDIIKKHEKKEKEKDKTNSKSSKNNYRKINIFPSDARNAVYNILPSFKDKDEKDIKISIKVNNKVKNRDNKENMDK